jgi:polysaccharide biosynthesis protein PslG
VEDAALRNLTVLLAVAIGLAGCGSSDSEPAPPRGLEVALQDNAVLLERHYYDRERAFDRLRELGVSWIRAPVIWDRVEREGWGELDSFVDAAADNGFHVQLGLIPPAPASATGDGRAGVFRPDPERFAAFARSAAERYRSRVRRWSIWNEPNLVNWLRPVAEMPALYRRLWLAGYGAIKSVSPDAQVLMGETAPYVRRGDGMAPLSFLRRVVVDGPLAADGYAHHSYDFESPPERPYPGDDNVTLGSIDRLLRELDRLAAAGSLRDGRGGPLDVWVTEFGYLQRTGRALPPARRADYVRRAFELAASRYPRVRQLLQYLLVSPPEGFPGGRFDTALLGRSGEPTPAFGALAGWARTARADGKAVPPPER